MVDYAKWVQVENYIILITQELESSKPQFQVDSSTN